MFGIHDGDLQHTISKRLTEIKVNILRIKKNNLPISFYVASTEDDYLNETLYSNQEEVELLEKTTQPTRVS